MDQGWTKSIEEHIAKKGNNCGKISLQHEAEADRCHNLFKRLTYANYSVGFLMAVFQIPSILTGGCGTNRDIWSYLTLTAFAIQVAIATILHNGAFDDKKNKNITSSVDFEIMKTGIVQQLSRKRINRDSAKDYQKYVDDMYNKATRYRPYVSKKFRVKYACEDIDVYIHKSGSERQAVIVDDDYSKYQMERFMNPLSS